MMCSVEKCSDPSGKTNAYVYGDKFYHGKEVEFSCRKGYTLVPSRSKRLTCQDGDWGTIPSCKGTICKCKFYCCCCHALLTAFSRRYIAIKYSIVYMLSSARQISFKIQPISEETRRADRK